MGQLGQRGTTPGPEGLEGALCLEDSGSSQGGMAEGGEQAALPGAGTHTQPGSKQLTTARNPLLLHQGEPQNPAGRPGCDQHRGPIWLVQAAHVGYLGSLWSQLQLRYELWVGPGGFMVDFLRM